MSPDSLAQDTRGRQFSSLLAAEAWVPICSECTAHRKEMVNAKIIHNVHKFMTFGTTIPLSNVQIRVIEATCVSITTLCRSMKEVENGALMSFSTTHKLTQK
jgi:hypothetical protein